MTTRAAESAERGELQMGSEAEGHLGGQPFAVGRVENRDGAL